MSPVAVARKTTAMSTCGTPLVEEVEQAISTISNYSVVQAKDSATHPALEESVDVLIRFLERATLKFVPARSSVTPTESIIFQLLQTFFLQHLFELRAEFHDLAISENASSSVVFCWVDLVLGYVSEAVLELLSSSPPLLSAEANATLNVQQKNTRLRAIAQLPRQPLERYSFVPYFQHLVPSLSAITFVSCLWKFGITKPIFGRHL
ncbi:hypothetical protein SISNIDRAFT_89518 [Sistotremastrum niveocremeum HHB9708]|uniref:Uncharacterized protein n=1 Tax=Sistotremastrum niveocremeum HHB9708 TaxID=1314777 RepID=A0A164U536_9AGAM|nr:hypothetical protein SISNIDRAFT_89518 [Sistotremastrum niveocremeum HHB9708]